jgi:hypothetical protein
VLHANQRFVIIIVVLAGTSRSDLVEVHIP